MLTNKHSNSNSHIEVSLPNTPVSVRASHLISHRHSHSSMILSTDKFAKFYTKLENHTHHTHHHHDHHQSQQLSSSLQAFRSKISNAVSQLALNSEPQSEILSLSWIQKFLGLLPDIDKAFAKLIVEIDYPMSKWESESVEGFLRYTLILLDLFNSISSSLSHLGQARMSLSHGLSLLENSPSSATKHLKSIPPGSFNPNFGKETNAEDREVKNFSGKEWVVHEAVKELKILGFWVCGFLLSGLCSDSKPYLEMRKITGGFDDSSVCSLDSRISEQLMEKMPLLKEIKEVNDSVANILAASDAAKLDAAMELQTQLPVLEKLMDDVSKEVDALFAKVMAQRNELIDCCRLRKQSQMSNA